MVRDDNPIANGETRDTYFDIGDEDVLYDSYFILRDYGYSHDDLAPLVQLVENATTQPVDAMRQNADEMIERQSE